MRTNKLISINYKLSKYIEKLISKVEVDDCNTRDMILIGFFNNSRIHFYSMNLLIEKKLYNSAFALVRVFFENIIKARYVYMFFEDAKIENMYQKTNWDKIFNKEPDLGLLLKENFISRFYISSKNIVIGTSKT